MWEGLAPHLCWIHVSPLGSTLTGFQVSTALGSQGRVLGCPFLHWDGGVSGRKLAEPHTTAPLTLPSRSGQADLAAIYHERIDVEGHHFGPSSPQRRDALKAVDTVLKYMTEWIQVTKNGDHEADLPSVTLLPSP